MPSEIQFVMHPSDEALFVAELRREPDVFFVDGPRWPNPEPVVWESPEHVGDYCIIWSPQHLQKLTAEYIPTCGDWYCNSEYATIQFLRSRLSGPTLSAGRIATSYLPVDYPTEAAHSIQKRFNRLRRHIKKHFQKSALTFTGHPEAALDSLWVGPSAIDWLQQSSQHSVSLPGGRMTAVLAPQTGADSSLKPNPLRGAAQFRR